MSDFEVAKRQKTSQAQPVTGGTGHPTLGTPIGAHRIVGRSVWQPQERIRRVLPLQILLGQESRLGRLDAWKA